MHLWNKGNQVPLKDMRNFHHQNKIIALHTNYCISNIWKDQAATKLRTISYVYTINQVLYIPLSYIKEYRCLKKVIHQIDSKNEWLLLSASLMAKFELVFVLPSFWDITILIMW